MSLNGSGVFSVNSAGQPVVASTLISAAVFNAYTADVATALSTALYKDGQQTLTANIPMGGFKHTGLGAGSAAGHSVRYEQVLLLAGGTMTGAAVLAGANTLAAGASITASTTSSFNAARANITQHATTMDLFAVAIPNILDGTGSAVTITAIVNAPQGGTTRTLYPVTGTIITNGATFAVDGAADYTTAAGDALEFEAVTTSTYKVHITKKDGTPLSQTIPQNSQSTSYTTVLSDAGKHILHPTADNNARTFTIASNASVPYPIGAAITFVNQINTVTIAITTDTMKLAGAGTTGSRTLAANGIATALKTSSTEWIISGTGLT